MFINTSSTLILNRAPVPLCENIFCTQRHGGTVSSGDVVGCLVTLSFIFATLRENLSNIILLLKIVLNRQLRMYSKLMDRNASLGASAIV